MARNQVTLDRIRGSASEAVSRAVDATVYLPLGIYDRARDQLSDLEAKRLRKTFQGLIEDLIDRGEDRVQPLERRLRREGRKVKGRANEATTDVRKTTRKVKKTTARAKKTSRTKAKSAGRKTAARATAAASNAEPKLTRVTAPRTTSELPIANYGKLTAEEITSRLSGLTQTELAKVYKYEKAHENRATILSSIEGKLVDLPIPTYDALTVDEISGRLERLNDSELRTIKSYEANTKQRSTIIEKVDARLS